jgi:hypothetical protein
MTRYIAGELRRLFERSVFKDHRADDDERQLAFEVAASGMHDIVLDWLAARIEQEKQRRGRGAVA